MESGPTWRRGPCARPSSHRHERAAVFVRSTDGGGVVAHRSPHPLYRGTEVFVLHIEWDSAKGHLGLDFGLTPEGEVETEADLEDGFAFGARSDSSAIASTTDARAAERREESAFPRLERQTVRNAPRYAENCVGQSARVGRGPAEFTSAGRAGACRPYETRLEYRSVKPIGVLARQTVRNAPRYAENCVGQSARVGRGPAEFTSAGRAGACRPYETRLECRSVKPIGVLGGPKSRLRDFGGRRSAPFTSNLEKMRHYAPRLSISNGNRRTGAATESP